MSYRRIEVNLLPPELQPGPAVRSALIINITLILGTAFAIILSSALSIYRYVQYDRDIRETRRSIENLSSVKDGYEQLQRIETAVTNYGAIVGIASTDYVDIPVLLSHLSTLLPEQVYLTNVSNTRLGSASAASVLDPRRSTYVSMTFNTSNKDLGLISRTLNALKQDPLFSKCVLTNTSLDSETLTDLSDALGINVSFDLPNTGDIEQEYEYYQFVIRAEVTRPLTDTGNRVIDDQLELFKASMPMPMQAPDPSEFAAQQQAGNQEGEPGVVGGPEGVTGVSNRGGN